MQNIRDINESAKRNHRLIKVVPFLCIEKWFKPNMGLCILVVFSLFLGAVLAGCSSDKSELIALDESGVVSGNHMVEDGGQAAESESMTGNEQNTNERNSNGHNSNAGTFDSVDSVSENSAGAGDVSGLAVDTSTYVKNMCFVHVCGAVINPGVYEIESGKHIVDAIDAANGFTDTADKDCINLATKIEDGMRIYVPTYDERTTENPTDYITLSSTSNVGSAADTGQAAGVNVTNAGMVNINTANADTLMTLPGIGQSKAAKIIDYREKNGFFKEISDIMNVDGIKNGMYDKIKDNICVN